jgi:pSer/pThr/pTyr-binding forkhead associated (FHA) protein
MDKCPFCGADTRPGDNFCLNCGNRLPAVAPTQQAGRGVGEATIPAENEWVNPTNINSHDAPTERADQPAPATIDKPARLTLRAESGEVLQDYVLEKFRVTIGRAPSSDVLLSKDKLTSRNHATIVYESSEYILKDEGSANGTFVNGQQLEEKSPYKLHDGDHVGIGEYELVFHAHSANSVDIESMPTIMVAPGTQTYSTQDDPQMTQSTSDEFGTRPWDDDINSVGQNHSAEESPSPALTAVAEQEALPGKVAETPLPLPSTSTSSSAPSEISGVTFGRLTSLPQPQLPDVAPLMAALATLDGQVSSLQEQLNATQEAMRNHDADIAQTTNQLRDGVRGVSERMDSTIAEVARSREQLAWAELLQLMEDVMNNPRDIEYVTKLARKARELNKVFQIHQNVLNTLAECTSQLRGLIGE